MDATRKVIRDLLPEAASLRSSKFFDTNIDEYVEALSDQEFISYLQNWNEQVAMFQDAAAKAVLSLERGHAQSQSERFFQQLQDGINQVNSAAQQLQGAALSAKERLVQQGQ